MHDALRITDGPAIAIGRGTTCKVAPLGMRPESALDDLRELLGVIVREHALEGLDEMTGRARLISARLVGVDDPDPRPAQRAFMKGGLFGIEPREPADVVTQDDVRLAAAGLGADGQQDQELTSSGGIEAAGVVGELADDFVPFGSRPRSDRVARFLDGEVLRGARSPEERVRWSHLTASCDDMRRRWRRIRSPASASCTALTSTS